MITRTIALLLCLNSCAALAQTVNFNNNILTQPPDRLVRRGHWGGEPLVGTNFVAVLLYGTSDSSLTPHTGTARFRVPTSALPGTWSGGTRTLTGMPNTPGSVVRLQVAVFDNNLFADYASAFAGGGIAGRSIVFDYMIPTQPPAPGSDSMVNFSSFVVYFVPEPSAVALGVVGLFTVRLFLRRRLQ